MVAQSINQMSIICSVSEYSIDINKSLLDYYNWNYFPPFGHHKIFVHNKVWVLFDVNGLWSIKYIN